MPVYIPKAFFFKYFVLYVLYKMKSPKLRRVDWRVSEIRIAEDVRGHPFPTRPQPKNFIAVWT
jgi:hypothetical protein